MTGRTVARSEYDAAYFTLLRAREEHDQLLRYREYLIAERDDLERFVGQLRERAAQQPRRMRRPIDQTSRAVVDSIGARRAVVLGELERMGDRLEHAQRFVDECEAEVAQLRP